MTDGRDYYYYYYIMTDGRDCALMLAEGHIDTVHCAC